MAAVMPDIDRDRVIVVLRGILEYGLPPFVTGLPEYDGLDTLVVNQLPVLNRRQMFVLHGLVAARAEAETYLGYIYDRLSPSSLQLILSMCLFGGDYADPEDRHSLVLAVIVGYLAYYQNQPLRFYLREFATGACVVYARQVHMADPVTRPLCFLEARHVLMCCPSLFFGHLPVFRQLS